MCNPRNRESARCPDLMCCLCIRICKASYSPLWVHRGVCRVCEEAECDAGRCPHRQACSPASFCPHLRACLSCTGGSCEECGFLFGDGEDVQCLVERLKPKAIYIDFDRTLCTTKGGRVAARGEPQPRPRAGQRSLRLRGPSGGGDSQQVEMLQD